MAAALQASSSLSLSASSSSSSARSLGRSRQRIATSLQVPDLPKLRLSDPSTTITRKLVEELSARNGYAIAEPSLKDEVRVLGSGPGKSPAGAAPPETAMQLCAILEAVMDRVEMHKNIEEQRDSWNKLLLNSVNMMTLSATTMAALTALTPATAMRASSALLFSAAAGISLIMNKIQPSQLAEEQRNATRLFKQLHSAIESILALRSPPTQSDVKEIMEKVLALDRAYPLPLLGTMLEKFPKSFDRAVWWPRVSNHRRPVTRPRKC